MEPRAPGKRIPLGTNRAKNPLRQFRQRIGKEEKSCGNAARRNAGFGVKGCWKLSKEGSKVVPTLPIWSSSALGMPTDWNFPASEVEYLADRRAGCGKSARPVRRGGRLKPMGRPYPYHSARKQRPRLRMWSNSAPPFCAFARDFLFSAYSGEWLVW